ncbi:hypothetical protein MMC11_001634 [Xylographa trunciseda]|nr:hypothetical protein [Xylographa trunciseda]
MELESPESLPSEDWISQPRSSAPVSEKDENSVIAYSTNTSHSRIPRLTSRSISNPSLPSRRLPGSPLSPPVPRRGPVLGERTASDINISQRQRSGLPGKNTGFHGGSSRSPLGRRQKSINSINSAPQGTVQQREKPLSQHEEANSQATPDWRKRVLARGDSTGRQPDLFSPIGLESVFRAPPSKQRSSKQLQSPRGGCYEPTAMSDYPSSPPPFPSAIQARGLETAGHKAVFRKSSDYVQPPHTKLISTARSRVESGESVSRNEEISLVQVANGRINYTTGSIVNSRHPVNNVRQFLEDGNTRESSKSVQSRLSRSVGSPDNQSQEDERYSDLTTHSLPEGLSIDTEAFISKGGFVNVLRGGCPIDDSFQKRPLSPSSSQPSSILNSDSDAISRKIAPNTALSHFSSHYSSQISVQALPIPAVVPITPKKNQSHDSDPPKSSGSPLKLFDAYDTYTNDRLVRRMSQFAEDILDSPIDDRPRNEQQSSPSPRKSRYHEKPFSGTEDHRATSFGSGDFDEYDFTHRQLVVLDRLSDDNGSDDNGDVQDTLPKLPGVRRKDPSLGRSRQPSIARSQIRQTSLNIPSKQRPKLLREFPFSEQPRLSSDEDDSHDTEVVRTISLEVLHEYYDTHNEEGKRFPPSPIRDPNPKRRRTITRSTGEDVTEEARNSITGVSSTKSIVSRKRKDARYDSICQAADPEVLASRPMLHPRTPSSNQVQNNFKGPSIQKSEGAAIHKENGTLKQDSAIMLDAHLSLDDAPIQALAGELAHFAYDVAQDLTYGDRKTSVTTADFTTAANLIMQNIRAQARPRSGRTSGEESETEHLADIEESFNEGSTIEEFSRPPSRVRGGTLRRVRDTKQLDPRVISHLRKFEENDETGIVLSSSLRSLKLGREDLSTDSVIVESDPPNVRIRDSLDRYLIDIQGNITNKENRQEAPKGRQSPSHRSQPSSGPSTTRSVPTGSSGGSGNKAMIAPDKVSHLISDNIGGMTFDRTRQVWVRKRSADNTSNEDSDRHGSELTEDDPLREIPDLSVDELEELKRIQNTSLTSQRSSVSLQNEYSGSAARKVLVSNELESRTAPEASISVSSKHSEIVSTATKMESAATSLRHQKLSNMTSSHESGLASEPLEERHDADNKEVEHEISILDGRGMLTPERHRQRHRQPRVVTVTFSSPLTGPTHIEDIGAHGLEELWEDNSDLDLDYSPEEKSLEKYRTTSRRISSGYKPRGSLRARHRISASKRNFTTRPVSRIDEHDELSMDQSTGQARNPSTDVIISTPQPIGYRTNDRLMPSLSAGLRSNISFHLSPLSDFTIHRNGDDIKSLTQESQSRQILSLHGSEDKYSLAIKELVEKITDVEPYEPYWECIRKLSLQGKHLATLYMLADFCARVEELDVSNNNLGQLDGSPRSVRVLQVRNNCLTNLTAWGHLHNLQYLDVSGNQIQSLRGFSSLVHLRELKADDNQIESLDGIANLNGLMKLRVRNNVLRSLNFDGYDLQRLVELDVQGNQVTMVSNLHELPGLAHVNLRDNKLTGFASGMNFPMPTLRSVDVSNNNITDISITNLPNIQSLYLDNNHVTHIVGLQRSNSLASIAWRNQTVSGTNDDLPIQFEDCHNLRTLQLSENKLQYFDPKTTFLNLQRLELSSAGVDCVSKDFGVQMPNLRSLNLNNNAVKDIRPLLGIAKLTELHLAGNRISRLRRTTAVLRKVSRVLESVDLRGNPLTVGFYGTSSLCRNTQRQLVVKNHQDFEDLEDSDTEECTAATYVVPPADSQADQQHRETLNEDTALRRRVYEMLVMGGCHSLTHLDGLHIDRRILERKDAIWERLLELGVLKEKEAKHPRNESQ